MENNYMNRPTRTRITIFLLLFICSSFPYALLRQIAPVQASPGVPGVVAESAPVPIPPIERKLFTGPSLGDNLIAAGEWVKANDLCTVYGVDYDQGGGFPVELFYLQECFGQGD